MTLLLALFEPEVWFLTCKSRVANVPVYKKLIIAWFACKWMQFSILASNYSFITYLPRAFNLYKIPVLERLNLKHCIVSLPFRHKIFQFIDFLPQLHKKWEYTLSKSFSPNNFSTQQGVDKDGHHRKLHAFQFLCMKFSLYSSYFHF